MARIPLGNFDQPRVTPTTQHTYAPGGVDLVGRAVERLGHTGQQVAGQFINEQAREQAKAEAEAKRKAEAMARAEAAHGQLTYELAVKKTAEDVSQQVITGKVSYDKAHDAYQTALKAIPPPVAPADLPDAMKVVFSDGLRKTQASSGMAITGVADKARYAHFQAQVQGSIDTLGKLAGQPGADIAAINAKGTAMIPLMQDAGFNEAHIQSTLEAFHTNNWTQQAIQRADLGHNSISALKALAHDLSAKDGLYAGKLDASHRNAVLSQVTNRIGALRARAERAQVRADAKGEQAIAQMDRQNASGIPATPAMMEHWADVTKGTSSATDFAQRVKEGKTIQKLLREPPAKQVQYVQDETKKLKTEGGSVHDAANLLRLKRAVAANMKQLETEPLLYNQARNGDAVKPLTLAELGDKNDWAGLTDELQDRAATIKGMRQQYGTQVHSYLLLPQELDSLKSVLSTGTAQDKTKLLGVLHEVAGDPKIYSDLMKQLYPKDPTMAMAGMAAHRKDTVTLESHLFSADDTTTRNVGETILKGDAIMKGKGDKSFKLPSDTDFRTMFSQTVGNLFAHAAPSTAQNAMNAVKAYYLGASADEGDVSGVVDDKRLKNAIKATLGEVTDFHGHNVLLPHGMDEDDFDDATKAAYTTAINNAGYSKNTTARLLDSWDDLSLFSVGSGKYMVANTTGSLTDAHNNPIIIDINDPAASLPTVDKSTPRPSATAPAPLPPVSNPDDLTLTVNPTLPGNVR